MKKVYLLYLLFFTLIISCDNKKNGNEFFNSTIYSPQYSSNFDIKSDDNTGNVLINVYNPWQGSKNIATQFLIATDSVTSSNFSGQVLKGKAKRIICMSSTHIAMLDELGAVENIVGVSGKQYISNSYIRNKGEEIPDIGYEGNIDYEKIVAANPDLILLFAINGHSAMEPKLKELGIPYLYIGDYLEENPLGKAEWILPIAEILGKRELGISKFQEIEKRYNTLKDEIGLENKKKPKVMVNAPFLDSWFMPSIESYVAQLIRDAGGDYIYKKNTGNSSEPIDMEEALQLVSSSDFWINIGTLNSLEEVISSFPKFINSKCIQEGNIYNNNFRSTPGGGNDCYESGVVNPDIVLRDLIKIFHPELISEEFTYYQKLE